MYCQKCGNELPFGARFCTKCGKPVATEENKEKAVCPNCNKIFEGDNVFCDTCGFKLVNHSVAQINTINNTTNSSNNVNDNNASGTKKMKLFTLGIMSKYNGTPTAAIAKSSGKITIYNDAIEYERVLGNPVFDTFGIIDRMKNSNRTEIINLDAVDNVFRSKYMGMIPTFVVKFKSGEVISFASFGGVSSADIDNAVRIVKKYI